MGGVGGVGNLGGAPPLNTEYAITLFGKACGLFGQHGLFLTQGGTYDVGVMVMFLFQMVFMDTALTIVTGAAAERWKYAAFIVSSFMHGRVHLSALRQLGVGRRLAGQLWAPTSAWARATATSPDRAWCTRSAESPRWRWRIIIGPRIGKYNRDGKPNAILGHDIVIVLTGCFILAFGWFGFNPGSTLGASGNGNLRIGSIAVNTMLAGMAGGFGAMFYMWMRYGKPDASMTGNGLLAGLVAITAPSGFVNPVGAVIIGLIAGVLVCLSVEFVERVMKVDDPVGAISVHGTNGLWGVISVGLFADGKSNYGGSWNGVNGSVTGLFYGDAGQLVAQLIGVATLVGFVFVISFVVNMVIDAVVGQRVSAKAELEGLDLPEMGQLGYPEFELKARTRGSPIA